MAQLAAQLTVESMDGEDAELRTESSDTSLPCSHIDLDFPALSTYHACVRVMQVVLTLPSPPYKAQLSLLLV